MALPYDAIYDAMLRRKVRELECRLTQAFQSPPPLPTTEGAAEEQAEAAKPTTTSFFDDIRRALEFLKNLLSAEMESHPGDKPVHLYHIADRLAFLEDALDEDALNKWVEFGTCPIEQTLEDKSMCSCTSSCFNEGDNEAEWMDLPNEEPPPPEAEAPEAIVPQIMEEERTTASEDNHRTHVKKVWTISAVVLLAVAGVGLVLTNMWLMDYEQHVLLVPT